MPYKNPDERRAYGREWIRRNAEKAREAMRRWRANHPDEHNAEKRAYYVRHREQILVQNAQYRREHPDVRRASSQNYRARKVTAEGSFTVAEWLALVEQYGGRCAYRGEEGPLHADHRTPLSRGGSNYIDNILPACRRCNLEKAQMTEEEFRERIRSEQVDR